MVETQVQDSSGYAVLSHDGDDDIHRVHGVALGVGDVTRGMSGLRKKWTRDALSDSAESLKEKPLVVNHVNHDVDAVVGKVTEAEFKDGVGVIWSGELGDDDLADKIGKDWLDVSPRVIHEPVEEMEVEGEADDPVHVVSEVEEFVNLSIVPQGAAPSNEISLGDHEDLMQLLQSSDFAEQIGKYVAAELGQHAVHEPEWSGLREGEWEKPALEDFTDESWEDLSEENKRSIADHYIVSKSGFPPERFSDLSLPVVDTEDNLVENAVDNAAARVSQVKGLSGEDLNRAESIIDSLQGEFEDDEENVKMTGDSDEEELGAELASTLESAIEDAMDEDENRADVVREMADAAGIEPNTVNNILNGEIQCPPENRLRGFADVLDVTLDTLMEAAREDGCSFDGEENQATDDAGVPTVETIWRTKESKFYTEI